LFTLEDKLITCDLARQWLRLRRTQELAKLKAEVAASNVPAHPVVGVCSSPSNMTPLCDRQTPPSISPSISPAPALTQHQGLGFRDLNDDVVDVVNDDDCAELDCDDESSDVFGDRGYDVVLLRDKRRVADLNCFGNDFAQAASDREEDTTIILD
jgi:hypothetical protein